MVQTISPSVARIPRGPAPPDDRLWSVQDVSYSLGIPVGTLYQWKVHRKGPPCRRIGRYLRYRPADVRAWVDELGDALVTL